MDANWFDTLTKSVSRPGTRRRLVQLVAALPLAGAVGGVLAAEHADGQRNGAGVGGGGGRRQRRRARHHPGQDKHNRKGKDKKTCAKAGQTPKTGTRKGCCQGLSTDASGRCAVGQVCGSGLKPCQGGCIPEAVCCGECGPDQLCTGGTCVAKVCGNGGPCVVFVSRTQFTGVEIGGLDGADAKCQSEAEVADSLAPPGVYKAWLSDDTGEPATRFVHSSGPYVLVYGLEVAANWADLTDGQLLRVIDQNQVGEQVYSEVWTNTTPQGLPTDPVAGSCARWGPGGEFGKIGATTRDDVGWTQSGGTMYCTDPYYAEPLYCFQQS